MAFFHSAGVYGRTGNEAGACCDCRFTALMGGLDILVMGVISLALRLCAGVAGDTIGILREVLEEMLILDLDRELEPSVELGLSISGMRPFGMLCVYMSWTISDPGMLQ